LARQRPTRVSVNTLNNLPLVFAPRERLRSKATRFVLSRSRHATSTSCVTEPLPLEPLCHRMRPADPRRSDTEVSHATQERAPRRRLLSRSRVNDGRVSLPSHASNAECALLAATKSLERSSVATTRARASLGGDFKNCCMLSGEFDGSDRNHFFQRVTSCLTNRAVDMKVDFAVKQIRSLLPSS
jgi:hypothetical protein